tara:strand:+ start:1096 stop:1296 length:201 start_codon:yes stop_codon:yes gene_type:complete
MTGQNDERKMLLWRQRWMQHLSQPGPKAVINGKPHPYPEESRQRCIKRLAAINELLAELDEQEEIK